MNLMRLVIGMYEISRYEVFFWVFGPKSGVESGVHSWTALVLHLNLTLARVVFFISTKPSVEQTFVFQDVQLVNGSV